MDGSDLKHVEQSGGFRMMMTQEFDGHFTVIHGEREVDHRLGAFKTGSCKRTTRLTFGEMLEQVAKLASRGEVKGRTYEESPDFLIRHGEVPFGYAAVIMPKQAADDLSFAISDFLCWADGFCAALHPDETSRRPLGVEAIRDLNLKLKAAISKVKS